MASKLAIYEQAAISLNGTLLVEAASIGVSYIDSDEAIALLGLTINDAPRRGVVISPGGRMMTIDVSEFRPVAGATVDILDLYLSSTEVELTIVLIGSGDSLITRGFIKTPSLRAAVGAALTTDWSFLGYAAKFERA
jgi:hypothetical protein